MRFIKEPSMVKKQTSFMPRQGGGQNSTPMGIGKQLNQLDQHISEIMLQSEDKLSPDSTPYAYSVELDTQMRTVRLIKNSSTNKIRNIL